jgi:hypothetical protein
MTQLRRRDFDWIETNSPVASSRTDDIHFFDPVFDQREALPGKPSLRASLR